MRTLSFDASSTTIGYSVLDFNDNKIAVIKVGYFKPDKDPDKSILEMLKRVQGFVEDLIKTYKPDNIAIEEIIQFMKGKSSAKSVITLAIVNRTVGLTCYNATQSLPYMYSVLSIRNGLKFTNERENPKKEDMPGIVEQHLGPCIPREYKKNKKEKDENCDMADAIAVGLFHLYNISGKINEIKKNRKLIKAAEKK